MYAMMIALVAFPASDWATALALKAITPVIVGMLTPFVVDWLKKTSDKLSAAPAYVKQSAAVIVAAIGTSASTMLEYGVPTDIGQWDETAVKTMLAALIGIAYKQQKQLKRSKAAAG
jgi:hypothetical protein